MERTFIVFLIALVLLMYRRGSLANLRRPLTYNRTTPKSATSNPSGFPLVAVRVPSAINSTTSLHSYKSKLSRKVFLLNTTERFSAVAPYSSNLSRELRLERVSKQARRHRCAWATNGGPFNRDGSTSGALIVNGQIIIDDFGGAVGLGVTAGPSPQWILGPIKKEDVLRFSLLHFVTGFDWLVYNGVNVAPEQKFKPAIKRAPRTAVGVDRAGNLIVMVADGCERW